MMLDALKAWYRRHFSDPQAVFLAFALIGGFGIVLTMNTMLAPALAGLVLAYLLEGLVHQLEHKLRFRRIYAVLLVYLLFLLGLSAIVLGLLPVLSRQVTQFFQELPGMVSQGQTLLSQLPERYPFVTESQINELMAQLRTELAGFGQRVVSVSLASIPVLITLLIYLILVPLLVFFFMKDKQPMLRWIRGYMPKERDLAATVWREMDVQIGNYVRGKFFEIIIVGGVSYITFTLFGLAYAPLLAVLVGLSVIIPYIGAAVVTIPVVLVALFQWGWGDQFGWLVFAYLVIQALDGNVLVPLLFSEVVNLHPVAIIVAVLVFGGLWGVWGVFFAIPLATLIKVLLAVWPRGQAEQASEAV